MEFKNKKYKWIPSYKFKSVQRVTRHGRSLDINVYDIQQVSLNGKGKLVYEQFPEFTCMLNLNHPCEILLLSH